jgi:hypothetical protein
MDISLILQKKYLGSQWSMKGNDYSTLDWLDSSPKPTEAELEALWPTVDAEQAHFLVEVARAGAYRETSDPIFFQWQRGDATEAEWLSAVEAVKTAHPYPSV